MAQVTFDNAGAGSGVAATTQSVAYPSNISANDLIIFQATIRSSTDTMGAPSGFSALYGPDAASSSMRQYLWYKLAAGTESGNLTVTSGGTTCKCMRMYLFKNQVQSASFYESGSVVSGANSGAGMYPPDVTPTDNDALAVAFIAMADDNAIGDITGETTADWAEAVAEFTTTSGSDGCIQLQTANVTPTVPAVGGSVATGNDNWVLRNFAIISASPTASTPAANIYDSTTATDVPTVDLKLPASTLDWVRKDSYSDDFNYTETPLQAPWGDVNGYSRANANGTVMTYTGTGGARYMTSDNWAGTVSCEVQWISGTGGPGVFGSGWNAYLFKYDGAGGFSLWKLSAWSQLGSTYTYTPTSGDTMRLEAEAVGTTTYLRCYVNNKLVINTSDSSSAYSSGFCWVECNGSFDNFVAFNYGIPESASYEIGTDPDNVSVFDAVGGNVEQYRDNFNRANETLTTPWGSQNGLAMPAIVSQELYNASAAGARYTPSDGAGLPQWSEIEQGGGAFGPQVMISGWNSYFFQYDNAGQVVLWKLPDWTSLDTYIITVSDGDVLRLEARASGANVELKGYVNGTLRCEYTDSSSPFTSGAWGFSNTGYADNAAGGPIGIGEGLTLEIRETPGASTSDTVSSTGREDVTARMSAALVTTSDSFDMGQVESTNTMTVRVSACPVNVSDQFNPALMEDVTVAVSSALPLDVSTPYDEVNITESITVRPQIAASVYDDQTVDETVTVRVQALKADIFDSLSVTEDLTLTMSVCKADTLDSQTTQEEVTALVGVLKCDIFDNVSVTEDTPVAVQGAAPEPNIYDNVTVQENVTGVVSLIKCDIFENGTPSESLTLQYASNANVFDSLAAQEDVTVRMSAGVSSIFDQVTTQEDVTVRYSLNASTFDNETVQESTLASTGAHVADIYDQVGALETLDQKVSPAVSPFDSESVQESVTVVLKWVPSVFDSQTVNESVTMKLGAGTANVFDTQTTTENLTGVVSALKCSVFDSETAEDTPIMGSQLLVYTTDNESVTENLDVRVSNPVFGLIYDSTTLTEFADFWVLEYEILRDVNLDPIYDWDDELIWVVTERYSKNAIVLEVMTATESCTCTVQSSVNPGENVTVNESVTVTMTGLTVEVFDTESVTESVTGTIRIDVNKSDLVTVEETVAFGVAAPANIQVDIFDSVTTQESVTASVSAPAVNVFDSQTIEEDIQRSSSTQPLPSVFDSVTVEESVTVLLPVLKPELVYDQAIVGEFVDGMPTALVVSVVETMSVAETVTASTLGSNDISVYDSTGEETVSVVITTHFVNVFESMSVGELATTRNDHYAYVVDNVTVTENLNQGINPIPVTLSDTMNAFDSKTVIVNPLQAVVTENVTVSESPLGNIGGMSATVVDSATVADVPAGAVSLPQASAEDTENAGENLLLVVSALLVSVSETETVDDVCDQANARWNATILEIAGATDVVMPFLPWTPAPSSFETYIIEAPSYQQDVKTIDYEHVVEQERHG